jgi:hypothetical protein
VTPPLPPLPATRRRAACPMCGRTLLVRADGLLRKHHDPSDPRPELCAGSYTEPKAVA